MSIIVLLSMIPLLLAVGALLTVAVGHHRELEDELAHTSAAAISFSGAQDALAQLEKARTLDGEFDLALSGGVARVVAAPWRADGVDNDDNGLIDEPEEGRIFSITSNGWINALPDGEANADVQSYHAGTEVVAEVVDFEFSFGQAIYIDDPLARIDLNGGAFELSGRDENLNGSPGTEQPRPAVGVAGDPAGVISQIAGGQRTQIIGNLPSPAIGATAELDFDDYEELLAPLTQMEWSGDATYSGAIGDFAARKGVIAHATGDLKLHGNTTGAGILLVDGDLEIDGRFTFAGVVIVRGNVSFQGGGSRKEIFGALLVWGEDGAGPPIEDLEINGTVQIAYSAEALALASATGGVRVLFWREQ